MSDKRFREEKHTLGNLCKLLGLSRQAHYKYMRAYRKRVFVEKIVTDMVKQVRKQLPRIGARKLYKMLKPSFQEASISIGRDKFFYILRRNGLLQKPRKRYCTTTDSMHGYRIYDNLIRDLGVSKKDELYVSDITYVRLKKGFGYLFLITDVYSRKIVGYDFRRDLSTEGAIKALKMSIRGKRTEGLIHHSDRGVQYSSGEYIRLLRKHKIRVSMSAKANPYENAIAERVNGILKTEFYLGEVYKSFEQAEKAVKEAIKLYNRVRPHMSIDYMTPEKKYAA